MENQEGQYTQAVYVGEDAALKNKKVQLAPSPNADAGFVLALFDGESKWGEYKADDFLIEHTPEPTPTLESAVGNRDESIKEKASGDE